MLTLQRCRANQLYKVAILLVIVWVSLCAQSALAATIAVSPGSGVYTVGSTFSVAVVVNTSGASINAADGTISFDGKQLSVVSVSRGNSIFSLWTSEPTFSNSAGTISFSGGSPGGYTGSAGTIMNVTFRTLTAGTPRVSITGGSVLAADGRGTNVLTSMKSGSYTISAASVAEQPEAIIEFVAPANTPGAPTVTSESHPMSKWSNQKTAVVRWNVPSDVTAVRTLLDKNQTSIPTKVYDSPLSTLTINDLEDGISYLHVQFKNDEGWGRVTHYRLAVDTTAPQGLAVTRAPESSATNPTQSFIATTSDAAGSSAIASFKVQYNGGEPIVFQNTDQKNQFTLSEVPAGNHTLVVEAFDEAGNSSVVTTTFSVEEFSAPSFTEVPVRVPLDVVPVLLGTTQPRAKVTVSVERSGQETQTYQTNADDAGAFRFIPDGTFTAGVYSITAQAEDENGAKSATSEPVKLVVEESGIVRFGSIALSVVSVLIPLLASLFVMIFGSVYMLYRYRAFRRKLDRETDEVAHVSHDVLVHVRTAVAETVADIIDSRKTKKLTQSEERIVAIITTEIDQAEKKITKEVADVTELVH
jgi:hypothetical protein